MQWVDNYLLQPFKITWHFIIMFFNFVTETSFHRLQVVSYLQKGGIVQRGLERWMLCVETSTLQRRLPSEVKRVLC